MRPGYALALKVLVLAALMFGVDYARADVIYSFVADQAAYDVNPGGTVSVDVYLQETLTGGSASQLVAQHGLFSFDVAIWPGSLVSDPAAVISAAADSRFDDTRNDITTDHVRAGLDVNIHILDSEGVTAEQVDAVTYRVLLATFTIQGGSVPDEVTAFSLTDYENPSSSGPDNNTFYWDDISASNPLDSVIGAGSFDVTVVPEPATMALLAMGGLVIVRRRKH